MNIEQRLKAAGLLGLPFAWGTDGSVEFGEGMTTEQIAAVEAVFAAQAADPVAGVRAAALTKVREQRQGTLAMLDGMQASALTKTESARATAIEGAKQGLRDLTKIDLSACVTADDFKATIMTRYRQIAAALPLDVRIAFAEALQ